MENSRVAVIIRCRQSWIAAELGRLRRQAGSRVGLRYLGAAPGVWPADARAGEYRDEPGHDAGEGESLFGGDIVATGPTPDPATVAATRTLRCGECGAMNKPLDWYCEKCGAELSAS